MKRGQPPSKANLPTVKLKFSSKCSDDEFYRVRGLSLLSLVPMGGRTTPAENADLAQVLIDHQQIRNSQAKIDMITGFLQTHPHSAWRASLLANLGMMYRREGFVTQAVAAWEEAWRLSRNDQSLRGRDMADAVVGNLAQTYAWAGNTVKLQTLFAQMGSRKVMGPATEKVAYAQQILDMMQVSPETAFKCGALALGQLLGIHSCAQTPQGRKLFHAQATPSGMSLSQVAALARDLGGDYQMAHREPGSAVITPSIVHWKLGHFSALKRAEGGRYLQQDADVHVGSDGPIWVSKAALDTEGSGYFLVRAGQLPSGWRPVLVTEGRAVFGRGLNTGSNPDDTTKCDVQTVSCKSCPCGMPVYNVSAETVSLNITDTPLRYNVPFGPGVSFTVTYNQRDVNQLLLSGFGPKWACNWLSSTTQGGHLTVGGGGGRDYTDGVNMRDLSVMTTWSEGNDFGFRISYSDGSVDVFGNVPDVDGLYSLVRKIDAQGNAVTLQYGNYGRLTKIIDAAGNETTVSYGTDDHPDLDHSYLITKVTDPFGRSARFQYDEQGRLVKITDMAGMSSAFEYDGDFITSMTTPYGTTRFQCSGMPSPHSTRVLEITDPIGRKERVEWRDMAPGIPYSESNEVVPVWPDSSSNFFQNVMLNYRNTFYWDAQAMERGPGDCTKAHIFHWLFTTNTNDTQTTTGILESEKKPLENRVWYAYPNQTLSLSTEPNMVPLPQVVARVVNGQTQIQYKEYNDLGNITKMTDPLGRTTIYNYDTNLVDVTSVQQQEAGGPATLKSITYNAAHQPRYITDASGQTTAVTYNGNGQPATVTNPKQETTTFHYNGDGYLWKVDGPNNSTLVTYGYIHGMVTSITDSGNFTVTISYDSLDRPVRVDYPDGTFEQIVYDKLDAVQHKDRMGRWTRTVYNDVRQPVAVEDAMHRVTRYAWCKCGSPSMLTDAKGNVTRWTHDLQGRVVSKNYPDGSSLAYNFENGSSRLSYVKDASGRITSYSYNLDDTLQLVTHSGGSVATAPVSFQYDSHYRRVTQMTDGIGDTTYLYNPAGQNQLGGGKLASVTGPLPNSAISYGYDPLGRVVSRAINGATNTVAYDALGRMTGATNALGGFTYSYVGSTERLSSMVYPNGQQTAFSYYGGTSDPRLQQITNYTNSNVLLSQFSYESDNVDEITKWTQQSDANAPTAYQFSYDPAGQLISAVLQNAQTGAKLYAYIYDAAGNRTSEQIDSAVNSATYNNLNQLITRQGGGKMRFSGTLSAPAGVTVGGVQATVTQIGGTNIFDGMADVTAGTNVVPVVAKVTNGAARTNRYQVVVSGGTTQTLTYDPNGNLVSRSGGESSTSYEWDAANRLTAMNKGTHRSEFTYDGLSRRVRIMELDNGVVTSDKRLLWDGQTIAEERDSAGTNVTKRYFSQGVQLAQSPIPNLQSPLSLYYTRDHLGSIRELTDSTGTIQARYDYDPYGRRTLAAGTDLADFGFTGHCYHAASSLHLALYRAYDADLGRWLSRDPVENNGINLYEYVENDPINDVDPLGLMSAKCMCALIELEEALKATAQLFEDYKPKKDARGGWDSQKPWMKKKTSPGGHAERTLNEMRRIERAWRRVQQDCKDDFLGPKCSGQSSGSADNNDFMTKMSQLTGLTGVWLAVYLALSEGSRIVIPARNAIPLP